MRLRILATGALTGTLLVGSVWAGVGLTPVGIEDATRAVDGVSQRPGAVVTSADVGDGVELGADEALVGAAKVDIEPRPDDYDGEWVRDAEACTPLTSGDVEGTLDHAADPRVTWIENNNCIYMGGFGIGPSQPVLEWDSYDPEVPVYDPETGDVNETGYGLWSRSVAISRGGGTLVLTILDGEGYFANYSRMCGDTPCGIHALQEQLAAELGEAHPSLGITADSFIFATTHAHSAMDFIGGWGGVPQWYMDQVAEAMRESVRRAVLAAEPAVLEVGETLAREHNGERRDTYHSAEDPTLNWLRATGHGDNVIAVVGSFAAHATSFGSNAKRAHADWPGVFAKRVEERFGDGQTVGVMFEAGLGNMSSRGGWRMGARIAELLPAIGEGIIIPRPHVQVQQTFWDQPVTNGPLAALGGGGFFDRPFGGPAVVEVGKSDVKPCRSASPVSVHVSAVVARIGQVRETHLDDQGEPVADPLWPDVLIASAPGEIFANYSNTLEEKGGSLGSLVIGQANDALGYMPQSFESDHSARQGGGFAGGPFEYEDAYSIDGCFGDASLEHTLAMFAALRQPRPLAG